MDKYTVIVFPEIDYMLLLDAETRDLELAQKWAKEISEIEGVSSTRIEITSTRIHSYFRLGKEL